MNTTAKKSYGTKKWRKWALAFSCAMIPFLFLTSCTKEDKKTNYTVKLLKIDGSDTLGERTPFIHWSLNVEPKAGASSVFKIAMVENGETAMQALEKHSKATKIASGSTIQYVQGYPLLEKGHHYAYQVDVTPGAGLQSVSSDIYTIDVPNADLALMKDDIQVYFLAQANIHTTPTGHLAIDVSWQDAANATDLVKVEVLEVPCCHWFYPDLRWVGPNGEEPYTGSNGHAEGGGSEPKCHWEIAKNREQGFIDYASTIVSTSPMPINAWSAGFGNSVIITSVTYDETKCYIVRATDVTKGWSNTFYVTGSL